MTLLTFKVGQPSHYALGKLIVCFVTPQNAATVCVRVYVSCESTLGLWVCISEC